MTNRIPRLLATVALGLAVASPALAQVGTTTRGDISGTTVDWSTLGGSGATVTSGTSLGVGGRTMTVTTSTGLDMERRDQGSGWSGNFASGDRLLWTSGANGPMTFTFDQLVSGFGTNIQSNSFGAFSATITLFQGALQVGTFTAAGSSTSDSDGSAIFIGMLASDQGTQFDRVELGVTPGQDFAINGPVISTDGVTGTVTPEPMTLALLGSGLLGLGGFQLRRRRSSIG
jgi:hypothetical protein